MSVDKGFQPTIASPPLAAVPIQSQPPPPSAEFPAAAATRSYQDVVADENLFMSTLEALHRSLGTKFMRCFCLPLMFLCWSSLPFTKRSLIVSLGRKFKFERVPKVGGRPLNLHRLFVEVTSRGGLQKVINDRIWKDVISAFNFPSTITNASFVLRKYYISLLQHYEKVYFNNRDLISPTTGTDCGSPSVSKSNLVGAATDATNVKHLGDSSSGEVVINQEPLKSQDPIEIAKLKNSTGRQSAGNSQLEIGSLLRGVITGKFENGYIVTAIYGSEKLTGVLYHAPSNDSKIRKLHLPSVHRSRKRSSQTMEDSSLSKPNSTNIYLDHSAKVNPSLSTDEQKISKQLGDLWNRLTQPGNEDNQKIESEE